MTDTTAKDLSLGFLGFCHEHGDGLSNLKLQKLLYYAQGWYLAFHDRPLFEEPLEAWIHGPVVRSVYNDFKQFGWKDITTEAPDNLSLVLEVKQHIAEVWRAYGHFTAYDLELMSHREAPWQNARKGLAPDVPSHNTLSLADMAAFFKSQMG